MWDNGMVDDPSTPRSTSTRCSSRSATPSAAPTSTGWRYNTLFRSSDNDLSDGMTIPNGEWFNGNMFGGTPLWQPDHRAADHPPPVVAAHSVTLIPTAGISVPVEVTEDTPFGATQYVSFMSVTKWGRGQVDHQLRRHRLLHRQRRELDRCAPTRALQLVGSSSKNFQQAAFVRPGDGYVYNYGTPNGRRARRTSSAGPRERHPQHQPSTSTTARARPRLVRAPRLPSG